ncbi:MAG: hypothetical protein LBL39_03950 [Planctomycetaceae bacterium]|nr:hypothetical protein [Planctomycetaceae bacterium]
MSCIFPAYEYKFRQQLLSITTKDVLISDSTDKNTAIGTNVATCFKFGAEK